MDASGCVSGVVFLLLGSVTSQSLEGANKSIPDSCYPLVGCFSNLPPWITPLRPALPPQHPENVSTTMHFYNRRNSDVTEFQVYPNNTISDVSYDKNAPTFVIYHCFMRNNTMPWIIGVKNEILSKVDGNVFVVKYSPENRGSSFEQNAGDIRVLAKIVQMTLSNSGIDVKKIHLIGYAGGAHAAAYTAKYLMEQGNGKVARLTGIAPMTNLFKDEDPSIRLNADDADFVEVFHLMDLDDSVSGHVDVYFKTMSPSGMAVPPPIMEFPNAIAHDYYLESMKTGCMMGYPVEMKPGNPSTFTLKPNAKMCERDACAPVASLDLYPARGTFVVETNPEPPYCIPSGRDEDDSSMEEDDAVPVMMPTTSTMKPTTKVGTVKGRF